MYQLGIEKVNPTSFAGRVAVERGRGHGAADLAVFPAADSYHRLGVLQTTDHTLRRWLTLAERRKGMSAVRLATGGLVSQSNSWAEVNPSQDSRKPLLYRLASSVHTKADL